MLKTHASFFLPVTINLIEVLIYTTPDRKRANPIPLYNIERSFLGIVECLRNIPIEIITINIM